jgi:hypothetical protein
MDGYAELSIKLRNNRSICGTMDQYVEYRSTWNNAMKCETIDEYQFSVTKSVTADLVKLLIARVITFRFSFAVYLATVSVTETENIHRWEVFTFRDLFPERSRISENLF